MYALTKGETKNVQAKFPSNFMPVGGVSWSLLDPDGVELFDGIATLDNDGAWNAPITIPKNVTLSGGQADFQIDFTASNSAGRTRTLSKTLTVIDAYDQWQDIGIVHDVGERSIRDFVFFDDIPSALNVTLREGYGKEPIILATKTLAGDDLTYAAATSAGFAFDFELPIPAGVITDLSGNGHYPYQLVVTGKVRGRDEVVYRPVYITTPGIITRLTSVKRFLDKARLVEIDRTLQFTDEETLHFLIEGMQYVNSFQDATFWTLSAMPSSLYDVVNTAAAWKYLNARFLAEGLNSFEMQGANVQLTFSRRDVIQTKMDELKGVLDQNLPIAKAAAIRVAGKGVAPPDGIGSGGANIGLMAVAFSPMMNTQWPRLGKRLVNAANWPY